MKHEAVIRDRLIALIDGKLFKDDPTIDSEQIADEIINALPGESMSNVETVREAAEKELWEENFRIDVEAYKVELRKKKIWLIVRFCKAFKMAWKLS